jgi:GcrA cell cycle regulator
MQGQPATSPWTDERVEQLKKLFASGISFAAIAAEIGSDISRNAIIGKIHRLKLTRTNAIGRDYKAKVVKRAAKPKLPRQQKPRKPTNRYATRWGAYSIETKAGEVPPTPVADLVPLKIALSDIGVFQCRWIVEEQPALFCGHPALVGSWCPTHRAIVFTPRAASKKMEAVAA